jgi:hypothetical protein
VKRLVVHREKLNVQSNALETMRCHLLALNPYKRTIFTTLTVSRTGLAQAPIPAISQAVTHCRKRLKMISLKMMLSSFAVAALLGTPALAKPPVHHDHPQRPPVLSTFNGVPPIGGRIGPDADPSVQSLILRDVPNVGGFN